eukprot:4440662-Pyramimonas_sp.AAC.2
MYPYSPSDVIIPARLVWWTCPPSHNAEFTVRATEWTLLIRATVWTLKAIVWTLLRDTVWTLKAIVWTLRRATWFGAYA